MFNVFEIEVTVYHKQHKYCVYECLLHSIINMNAEEIILRSSSVQQRAAVVAWGIILSLYVGWLSEVTALLHLSAWL
jgi:hypothetical protein